MSREIDFEFEDYEGYKARILIEISKEARDDNPLTQRLKIVEFVSRSSGRGRKRRSRGVTLLVVDNLYAYVVKNGEIRERKKRDRIGPDVLANEVLSSLPSDERTTDKLLDILRPIK